MVAIRPSTRRQCHGSRCRMMGVARRHAVPSNMHPHQLLRKVPAQRGQSTRGLPSLRRLTRSALRLTGQAVQRARLEPALKAQMADCRATRAKRETRILRSRSPARCSTGLRSRSAAVRHRAVSPCCTDLWRPAVHTCTRNAAGSRRSGSVTGDSACMARERPVDAKLLASCKSTGGSWPQLRHGQRLPLQVSCCCSSARVHVQQVVSQGCRCPDRRWCAR